MLFNDVHLNSLYFTLARIVCEIGIVHSHRKSIVTSTLNAWCCSSRQGAYIGSGEHAMRWLAFKFIFDISVALRMLVTDHLIQRGLWAYSPGLGSGSLKATAGL